MKHYGDITKIKGADVPIVDIVCGGSPCQDLSVAGLRKGLQHSALGDTETTRSGLFMEQIRIIKEMREHDRAVRGSDVNIRPRYMVWENVPGAFSSNGGEDFRSVLEETARVADKAASIPRPEGGWSTSGCILGDGWSLAWRVHDAQFWGVPQRRKRISLVADFGGDTAPKILFESESVSGDFEQSRKEGETTPASSTGCLSETGAYTLKVRGGVEVDRYGKKAGKGALVQTELSATLGVSQDQTLIHTIGHDMRGGKFTDDEITDPLTATDYKDPIKVVHHARGGYYDAYQHYGYRENEQCGTLTAEQYKMRGDTGLVVGYRKADYGGFVEDNASATLKSSGGDYGGGSESLIVR